MANEKDSAAQQSLQPRAATTTAAPPAVAPAPSDTEKAEALVVADTKILRLRTTLDNLRPWFANALPKHITAERFVRVVLTAVQRTPKLLECNRASFFTALMQCAALGLEPDGLLGQAYLVPFRDQVQFIPGYRGLIKLVRQSGEMAGVYARVVRERDEFSYEYGLNESLVHVPHRGDEAGELVAVYAVARFKGNQDLPQFDVMERWEVDRIRDMSEGYQYHRGKKSDETPWIRHYDAMAMKTVLRRLCKMLPQSVDKDNLARAIALDEQAEANLAQQFESLEPEAMAKIEPDRPDAAPETQGRRMPLGARGERVAERKKTLTIDTSAIDNAPPAQPASPPKPAPPIPLSEMTDKERREWEQAQAEAGVTG